MSTRRLQFELYGSMGNLETVLNRASAGITRTGTATQGVTREMGLWERQMMALGTTARYALAGGVVFGVSGAIASLSQFERKFGQISALMGGLDTRGGAARAGQDVNRLADYTLLAANRLATPVDQIQNQMQIFYSSFQVPQGQRGTDQVEHFTDIVTKLGAVSETTDFTRLTEGVIGFTNALGRGLPDTERFSNMIARFVNISIGFRGDVLGQYLGQIGSTAALGGFTAPQALGLVATVSRAGGSPAVVARGSSQLMRQILQPRTAAQKQAYAEAGLPTDPNALTQLGGPAVLQRMLNAVRQRGGLAINRHQLRSATDETLGEATTPGDVGVRGGGGAALAFHLFSRVEALRAFAILSSQGGTLKRFTDEIDTAGKRLRDLNEMFNRFRTQAELSAGATAFSTLGLATVRQADPLLHLGSRGIQAISNFAIRHQTGMGVTEGVLAAALGVRALGRFTPLGGVLGRAPGPLGRLLTGRGGGRAIQGAVGSALAAESLTNVLTGGAADGTRANPFWIIIHPDSWMLGSPGGLGRPIDKGGGGAPSVASRIGRRAPLPIAGGALLGPAAAITAPLTYAFAAQAFSPQIHTQHVFRDEEGRAYENVRAGRAVIRRYLDRPSRAQVDARARSFGSSGGGGGFLGGIVDKLVGEAEIALRVDLTDRAGRVLKVDPVVHVPVKLFPERTAGERHRGKRKTVRGR